MYTVQTGVSVPGAQRPKSRISRRKYPFHAMQVGDMFFVPNRSKNTLNPYVSAVGKSMGCKFSTRLTYMKETLDGWEACEVDTPGAVQGVGVWRVK